MAVTAASPADVVARLFRARRDGNVDDVCALLAPDLRAVALADGHRFNSAQDVRDYVGAQEASAQRSEMTASRLSERGSLVLVEGRLRVLGDTGLADSPAVWVFEVRDGLIASCEPFHSVDAALDRHPQFAP